MGQNQSTQQSSITPKQLIIKGFHAIKLPSINHHDNEIELFRKDEEYTCLNRFHFDTKSPNIPFQHSLYYEERMKIHSHPNIISLHYYDIIDQIKKESLIMNLKQFGTISQNKVNVNTICSLNIFDKNCKKTMLSRKDKIGHIWLHLYQQFILNTLEEQIQAKRNIQQHYSEKQIWEIIINAVNGALALTSNGFKQPVLSPNAIKIKKGIIKVGEWQFSHFYERQNQENDEQTHFLQEGETFVKPMPNITNESKIKKAKQYNLLTSYYWAPQGTSQIQTMINLGRKCKTASNHQLLSQQSLTSNNQVFSLGMTILHLCLMRPLYQSQTFSEKRIKNYIQEAVRYRNEIRLPLSQKLVDLLERMLEWDPEDRISYEQIKDSIVILKNSHTGVSVLTTDQEERICCTSIRQNQKNVAKSFILDVDGSGSINQGNGDFQHPLQQSQKIFYPCTSRSRIQSNLNLDYHKVDFTIKRQRKQWQKLQNRIQQSSYKVLPSSTQIFKNISPFYFPAETLLQDGEDSINQEILCKVDQRNGEQRQRVDENEIEYACSVGVGGVSRVSDSIRLLDISNIRAHDDNYLSTKYFSNQFSTIQKHSLLKFNAALDQEESFSKLVRQKKSVPLTNSQNDSMLLKSSVKPIPNYPMINSQAGDLFTPPELLALIRSSTKINKSLYSSKSKEYLKMSSRKDKNFDLMQHYNSNLANSTFVRESFAKGYYEGGKSQGLRNGYGTFYYNEGGKYCGDWLDNQMHGKGTLYYADGRIAYQGEWRYDSLNGKGILYNENPSKLNGQYDFNSFDQSESCWVYYEGTFHSDDKWGSGVLLLSNGQRYQGEFKNDVVQGKGVFYTLRGIKVEGEWQNNMLIKIISQTQYCLQEKSTF